VDPDGVQRSEKIRLATVSEIEGRWARGSQRFRRKARRKRVIWGLVLSVLISGTVGVYLGYSSHRTDAELADELRQARTPVPSDLESQADRLINEMWKSEALEKTPRIH
jgi:hypothetical protein